jgi:preprotein translocase subunit SecF
MRILTEVNVDWLRWRWHTLALSVLVIVSGLALVATRGLPLGIDFSGGTLVILQFENPTTEDAVRNALASLPGDKGVQQYGDAGENQMLVRLPQTTAVEEGFNLEEGARQLVELIRGANLGGFEVLSTEVVGPVIGEDLQRKGIYATLAAIVGIMTYIAFRFRFSFGIGAMAASLHDVLVTLSVLAFAGYELSLNVVAAILTLVGYGVNDQIVIFDRVRENLRSHRRDALEGVINKSVNQTLPRTIITAGTTFLSVLALYVFGGEVLRGFAFTMLIGIVTSTYSTVFIASAIAVWLSGRKAAERVTAVPATRSVPAEGAAAVSARKRARKAKAS